MSTKNTLSSISLRSMVLRLSPSATILEYALAAGGKRWRRVARPAIEARPDRAARRVRRARKATRLKSLAGTWNARPIAPSLLADGKMGPELNLRPLFEQFVEETSYAVEARTGS